MTMNNKFFNYLPNFLFSSSPIRLHYIGFEALNVTRSQVVYSILIYDY